MKAKYNFTYRHVKTGRVYIVVALGRNELTLEEVVVYAAVDRWTEYRYSLQDVWVRPRAEFEDGRFDEVTQ